MFKTDCPRRRACCPRRLRRIASSLSIAVGALVLTSGVTVAEDTLAKANWLLFRGSAYFSQRHVAEAIEDFTAAIELSPNDTFVYAARSMAYEANGDYPAACADYSRVLELEGGKDFLYVGRGRIEKKMGQYREALADYDTAISKNPLLASAFYAKAMLLAACPDDAVRDGIAAVRCASRGCELTDRARPHLNALAAAYAEFGDWQSAAEVQTEANQLAKEPDECKVGEERLRLYREKQPYRETAAAIERDRVEFLSRPKPWKLLRFVD